MACILGVLLVALFAAPWPGTAQEVRVGEEDGARCPDPGAGTLGITGLECDHCNFSRSRTGFTRADFLTEPAVFSVDGSVTRGDELRVGDVLVALDGELITTDEGSRRFTSIRAGEWVEVTVRRDGRRRELRIRAGTACEARAPAPEAPLAPTAPSPVGAPDAPSPLPPLAPSGAQPPSLPAPPAPGAVPPDVSLGFSFACDGCSYSNATGAWTFTEAPVVFRVKAGSSAEAAGLRKDDVLLALDGVPLPSEEGARRFASMEPGREVVWTVRRGGRRVEIRHVPAAPAPAVPQPPGSEHRSLRYTGAVGPAEVEVRGAPVSVSHDRRAGVLVINHSEVTVIIRVPPEGGG